MDLQNEKKKKKLTLRPLTKIPHKFYCFPFSPCPPNKKQQNAKYLCTQGKTGHQMSPLCIPFHTQQGTPADQLIIVHQLSPSFCHLPHWQSRSV
jgi:hypothetical protein